MTSNDSVWVAHGETRDTPNNCGYYFWKEYRRFQSMNDAISWACSSFSDDVRERYHTDDEHLARRSKFQQKMKETGGLFRWTWQRKGHKEVYYIIEGFHDRFEDTVVDFESFYCFDDDKE